MSISHSKIATLILKYSNAERERRGLRKLSWSVNLQNIAKLHSKKMARAKHIWHGDGVHQAGGTAGENVALMYKGRVKGFKNPIRNEQDIARALVRNWMNSPGHRDNILNTAFGSLGVGISRKDNGFYATQLFNDTAASLDFGTFLNKKTRKSILKFLWWWLTFTVGLLIANELFGFFKLEDFLLTSFLCGIAMELSSQLTQCLRFKGNFVINRHVILWFIVHGVSVAVVRQFIPLTSIIAFSFVFTILTHGIWKFSKKRHRIFRNLIVRWFNIFAGLIAGTSGVIFFRIKNFLLAALLVGFSIQLSRKVIHFLRKKSNFQIDKWFFFWGVVFSVLYLLSIEIHKIISTITINGTLITKYLQLGYITGDLTILSLTILLGYYVIRKLNLHNKIMSLF
jgi:hypothetical protein